MNKTIDELEREVKQLTRNNEALKEQMFNQSQCIDKLNRFIKWQQEQLMEMNNTLSIVYDSQQY